MLLVVAGITSIVALMIVLWWQYWNNINWQIKLVTASLNQVIRGKKPERQKVQQILKKIHVMINKSIAQNNSQAVYQSLDLLKLAYGNGLVRPRESTTLTGICIAALHSKNPDTVSFVLDAFRPLVRQLPPEEVVSAVDQLTLIGAMALKQKYNFLAAKVVECVFFVMEQHQMAGKREIVVAGIKTLKVIGVLGLRRRDLSLFREMNMRLLGWLVTPIAHYDVTNEIIKMLSAWLYRIVGLNDKALFEDLAELTKHLIDAEDLSIDGIETLIDEWGDVAATACLNPNNPMAGLILEFLFSAVERPGLYKQWIKVVAVAGRVAKLAVHRRGLIGAFRVVHPIVEVGRRFLRAELKFVEYIDELHQQQLFRVVRECLTILNYAAKQNIMGSTGEIITDLFTRWLTSPECSGHHKSIKKYCQLLLLFWLKNKKQAKRYMPRNVEIIEPMLFSELEKQRLGL